MPSQPIHADILTPIKATFHSLALWLRHATYASWAKPYLEP